MPIVIFLGSLRGVADGIAALTPVAAAPVQTTLLASRSPRWMKCGDELAQTGDPDLLGKDEFRKAVRNALELLVASVGQAERGHVAGKCREC